MRSNLHNDEYLVSSISKGDTQPCSTTASFTGEMAMVKKERGGY